MGKDDRSSPARHWATVSSALISPATFPSPSHTADAKLVGGKLNKVVAVNQQTKKGTGPR
jgi:hypothetical protein